MTLNPEGIVARIFLFCRRLTRSFANDPWWDEAPERTDLCTVARTIFVTAPLAVAINLVVLGCAGFAIGYFAFVLWLNISTIGLTVAGLIAIAAIGAGLYGLARGAEWVMRSVRHVDAVHEVGSTVAAYYRAKKDRICPIVEIKGRAP